MTIRYICRSHQRTLFHVYAKLLRISNTFQSGVTLTTFWSILKLKKFFLSGVRQLISKLPTNITIPFLGQDQVPVTSVKDLGVKLDLNLTFSGHNASLTSSLLSALVQINRVWHLFSEDVLYIIRNSLVFSKRFYCSIVWSGTSKENIHKLQLMQKNCWPNTTNTKKFDHITPVLHELGWLTIEELLCLCDVIMIFKCLSGLMPSYLRTKFVKCSETHSYCTKQNNQLYLFQYRTSSTQCASVSGHLNIGTVLPMLETLPLLRFLKGRPGLRKSECRNRKFTSSLLIFVINCLLAFNFFYNCSSSIQM